MVHLLVKPFTVKKDLRVLEPISKSSNLKVVLSGVPLKKVNMNVGAPVEIGI